MVNTLAPTVGGQTLTCADRSKWPGGGVAGTVTFPTIDEEATWVTNLCKGILWRAPSHRIAVVVRYRKRRAALDAAFAADTALPSFRWDQPFVDKEVVDPLRSALRRANPRAAAEATSVRDYLWQLADGATIQDPSLRESMSDATAWAADEFSDGNSFSDLAHRIATLDGGSILTTPGVHLLSGHSGKGQQFDWTIVAGLEEGTIPFFKADSRAALLEEARVLSVMVSRARHGVVMTRASSLYGRGKNPSRFLQLVEAHPSCFDEAGLREWLNSADWKALSKES
jgi:DNA helicase-2/ATP-dependent DNA helicase PcrA